MCGRFSQLPVHLQAELIAAMHRNTWPGGLEELPPRYNLAPTELAGVLHTRDGEAAGLHTNSLAIVHRVQRGPPDEHAERYDRKGSESLHRGSRSRRHQVS